MEERHEKVMEGLSKLEAPLGLKDSEIPEVPDFGVEIRAHYRTKNSKTKGVSILGDYIWRDESSEKGSWDSLEYDFKIKSQQVTTDVLKQMLKEGVITKAQYNKWH